MKKKEFLEMVNKLDARLRSVDLMMSTLGRAIIDVGVELAVLQRTLSTPQARPPLGEHDPEDWS